MAASYRFTDAAQKAYIEFIGVNESSDKDRECFALNYCFLDDDGNYEIIEPSTELEEFDAAYNRECNIADIEWKEGWIYDQ